MKVAEKMWVHWLHALFFYFYFFTVHIYLGLVSWQDLSYFCEGLSQSLGSITMPLLHTVLKMYFYLPHYLCVHLSTEHFIWIGFIWQLQSGFSTPTCSKPLTLGVFIFLSPLCWLSFLRTFFLGERVTQAMLSQQGSQGRGKRSQARVCLCSGGMVSGKVTAPGVRQSRWQLLWR